MTVGAGFARGLFEFAVSRGAEPTELLARAGIAREALTAQDGRVPFNGYVALMRAAKAMTGDPALALHYGESVDIAKVSIVGLIAQATETMVESLAMLNRYVRLIVETENEDDGDRFQFRRDRGGLWMVDTRRHADAFPELTESAFAQLICSPRRFTPGSTYVKAVHVTHPAPAYRDEYERIFRAPVVFESDRNALQIDETTLTSPVSHLPRYAFGVLSGAADALLQDLENSKSMRGRIEALLRPILHSGEVGMDLVAQRLGVSRQTLFRRLKAEGVTYEKVLDDLRRDLAQHYLGERGLSVNETAYLLGFSEPAAFSRAYKRWTGSSPRAARAAAS